MEKTFSYAAFGGACGGLLGATSAAWSKPVSAETSMAYVVRSTAVSAGELAGIAAIFAATESILTGINGHTPMNSAIAGCAAGSLIGVRQGSIPNAAFGCATFGALQFAGALQQTMNGSGGH